MIPSVIVFDVDETLTESKRPVTTEMAELLSKLLEKTKVAFASGGKIEIMKEQIADRLPEGTKRENLYLLPTSGSTLLEYKDSGWKIVYQHLLTEAEATEIIQNIEAAIQETGVIDLSVPSFGDRVENRGSQVTLSALGQTAPIAEKIAWDPERTKRPILREAIAKRLPRFDVKTGGATSVDVTKPGLNKAFGVRELAAHLSIPVEEMLYVGDALFPGGNDEVVKETGIKTRQVTDPLETATVIQELLSS